MDKNDFIPLLVIVYVDVMVPKHTNTCRKVRFLPQGHTQQSYRPRPPFEDQLPISIHYH